MKIFSLNMGDIKKGQLLKINEFCQEYQPDVIVLQEVKQLGDDLSSNTSVRLNELLEYPYSYFLPVHDVCQDYGKGKLNSEQIRKAYGLIKLPNSIWEWLAVWAKKEFKTKEIKLPIRRGIDRWPRSALVCDFGEFEITNIHLTPKPSDKESAKIREKQLWLLGEDSILVGDFNMLPEELALLKGNRTSSFDFQEYVSFENEYFKSTLDYSLLPKGNWQFEKIEILKGVSDHHGVFVEIKM